MISVKNVSKTYNNKKVLDKIDLEIKQGEIVSIVGPSGAGKTTLLNIISTLDKPDVNTLSEVMIDNIDVTNLNDSKLSKFRNTQIGFIFQFHELLPEFSAIENVIIPAIIKGENKESSIKKAIEILDSLGLSKVIDQHPSQLSGGEQQRVAVARALVNNPELILADEPTGNLDPETSEKIMHLLKSVANEEKTVIMATHDFDIINKYPARVVKFNNQTVLE